jgi:ligand-binding sensor domain-containing protein
LQTNKRLPVTIQPYFLVALMSFFAAQLIGQNPISTEMQASVKELMGDTVSAIDGEIRGIVQDSKNNLWFASNGNGVYKYDGSTLINFTEKQGLASNYVWMVQEHSNGTIWFKTNVQPQEVDAICYFDGTAFKTIQPDTRGVWEGFRNEHVLFDYYFDGTSLSKIQLPQTSPIKNEENKRHHYDIYSTCVDKSGNTWFGTCTAGICKYDGKTFRWFDNTELGAAIRDIYEDAKGTIWAGNNGDGLFRFDGTHFINFSKEKNLQNPDFIRYPIGKPGIMSRVWKITEDAQGNLLVATIDNGLWKYDGYSVTNFTAKEGLLIDAIWTVYTDTRGIVWVGTEGDGVYQFDGKAFKKFKPGL